MTAIHEGGRQYLSSLLGIDCSSLTNDQVFKAVDSQYPGGWAEFSKGWGEGAVPLETFYPDLKKRVVKKELTRFQQMQSVMGLTGQAIRLGLLDEVLEIKIRETEITVSLRVFKVVEQTHRWKIVNEGLKRLRWVKKENFWIRQHDEEVWVPEGIYEPRYVVNSGSIQTDEVWNDKRDQWHLCYRPGTSRSPMDGPESLNRAGEFEYYDSFERKRYGADN